MYCIYGEAVLFNNDNWYYFLFFLLLKGAVYEITDNYEIKDIIGRGAFGIVFSAYDKDLKSFVAIKKVIKILIIHSKTFCVIDNKRIF